MIGLLLALHLLQPPSAAFEDTAILRIRRETAAIDAQLSRCARQTLDVFGMSTEGGTMDVYRCGGTVRKIYVRFEGESGRASETLYLTDGRLEFDHRVEERYDRLGRVVHSDQERLYLRGGTVLRWIENAVLHRTSSEEARARAADAESLARELLDRARTGRTDGN